MSDIETLEALVGKTISSVEVGESYDEGAVSSVTFTFEDGTEIKLQPTSYNYGNQNLVVS